MKQRVKIGQQVRLGGEGNLASRGIEAEWQTCCKKVNEVQHRTELLNGTPKMIQV